MGSFFQVRGLWKTVRSLGCVAALTAMALGASVAPAQEGSSGLVTPCSCTTCTIDSSCDSCSPDGGVGCCQSPGFALADHLPGLACRGISVGGWLSGGIYANGWSNSDNNLPLRNETRGALDQMWIFAEKEVCTQGCGIDWGGRVDFMFGADAPYTQAGPDHNTLPMFEDAHDDGWDHAWDTSADDRYGFAMPQLYGEIGVNDLTVRVGHFYSLIGYESVPAVNNFFYSHSYALGIEPITHMGALASYRLHDSIEVTGGITNGWDNGWLNPTEAATFLGKLSLQLTESMKLDYALSFGQLGPGNDVTLHSLIFDWQLSRRWQYVLQANYGTDCGHAADVRQDYGMNQYLFYRLNACWKIGTRVEWLRGETFRTVGFGTDVFETRTGLSFGANYSPCAALIIRPEIRWDGANGRLANDFNDRQNTHQFSGGLDMIYKF